MQDPGGLGAGGGWAESFNGAQRIQALQSFAGLVFHHPSLPAPLMQSIFQNRYRESAFHVVPQMANTSWLWKEVCFGFHEQAPAHPGLGDLALFFSGQKLVHSPRPSIFARGLGG